MYEKIKRWYMLGLWTVQMVNKALDKHVITEREYSEIVKEEA